MQIAGYVDHWRSYGDLEVSTTSFVTNTTSFVITRLIFWIDLININQLYRLKMAE